MARLWLHRYTQEGVQVLEETRRLDYPRIHLPMKHVRLPWAPEEGWAYQCPAPARSIDVRIGEREGTARVEQEQSHAHLQDVDKCGRRPLPVICMMWMKGSYVPTLCANLAGSAGSALGAAVGFWVDHEHRPAGHLVALLRHGKVAYFAGLHSGATDNDKIHEPMAVRSLLAPHLRVQGLWLPTRAAPDANPLQLIWGLMKDHAIVHRLFGSIEKSSASVDRFFADLLVHSFVLLHAA